MFFHKHQAFCVPPLTTVGMPNIISSRAPRPHPKPAVFSLKDSCILNTKNCGHRIRLGDGNSSSEPSTSPLCPLSTKSVSSYEFASRSLSETVFTNACSCSGNPEINQKSQFELHINCLPVHLRPPCPTPPRPPAQTVSAVVSQILILVVKG